MTSRAIARVQEKGQVTLPAELRRKLGLRKGDLVAFEEVEGGIMLVPQAVLAARLLDEIGDALRERGLTLEELIESGRDERVELLKDAELKARE